MEAKIYIKHKEKIYQPIVLDDISLSSYIKGSPSELCFDVLKDEIISFLEGDRVNLIVNEINMFSGFIFKKTRNKNNVISVVAYDQLRYLKNKDTYNYSEMTASSVIKMIAKDFYLEVGEIEDSTYIIPSRVEESNTLFDIILTALDLTKENTGQEFVFFDEFGFLSLRNIENNIVDLLIDEDSFEDFSYTSSIDSDTYNSIKLKYEDNRTGIREVYVKEDEKNIGVWGKLQYFDSLKEEENGNEKAKKLLELYNKKSRSIVLKNVVGDLRVRAGCIIGFKFYLGDIDAANYMVVESCVHKFSENEHFMDLVLRGGDFDN